jgi:hypothetical protein
MGEETERANELLRKIRDTAASWEHILYVWSENIDKAPTWHL